MIYGALGEFALGEIEAIVPDDTILPSSIASAEAFGSPVVSGNVAIIGAGGIAGAEAFDSPTLTLSYNISPSSIASAEAFGVPFMGVEVTYEKVSRATMAARRILNLGGVMAVKFASYYYGGGTQSISNATTDTQLNIDTESVDENSLATLAANTVTINALGSYLVYAIVAISAGGAFNGNVGVKLYNGGDVFTEGYATAMSITSDLVYIGPLFIVNTSTFGIGPRLDNSSGQTLSAYLYELTLIKLD
jgi:hypothetical protein